MAERRVVSTRTFVDQSQVGTRRPAGTRHEYQGMKDADWDCTQCGHADITGNIKICPTCGNPKDASEPAQPPPADRPFLTAAQMTERGVDRDHGGNETCPYCQSEVAPKTQVCPQCQGNIANVGKTNRICPSCQRETNELVCPGCGVETDPKAIKINRQTYDFEPSRPETSYQDKSEPTSISSKIIPILIGAGVIGLILLCIFGAVMYFSPKINTGTVSASNWSCEVPLIQDQYNFHGDWSLPDKADFIKSYEKFHHNNQVYVRTDNVCKMKREVVGQEPENYTEKVCETESVYVDTTVTCYSDDTCEETKNYKDVTTCKDEPKVRMVDKYGDVERCEDKKIYKDVPVNQTWYEYNIWEWVSISPVSSQGDDNSISCPVVKETDTLRTNGNPKITCSTTFKIGDNQYPYSPDCTNQFPQYTLETRWQVTIFGPIITKVEPLP